MIDFSYAFALIAAALIATQVAWVAWRRRPAPGALALITMASGMVVWTLTYAFMWLTDNLSARSFWLDATYLGVLLAVNSFFVFAVQFAQREHWLTRSRLLFLALFAGITLLVLWTDPYHHLFYGDKRTPTTTIIYDGGFWFWINISFIYALMIFASGLIVYAFVTASPFYRWQTGTVLLGTLVPLVSSLIGFFKLSPIPELDLTPIMFSISGAFFALGVFRFRMLDIVPIARNALVENMPDAMLILDTQNRILEINPAAQRLFDLANQNVIGEPASQVLGVWHELMPHLQNTLGANEIALTRTTPQFFDLTISPIYNHQHHLAGRLILLRDVTVRHWAQDELRRANEKLQTQLSEIEFLHTQLREQAIRDSLTGLFNRRYMEETLERELHRAERAGARVSIIMLDIDHFKPLNDHLGHQAGDQVLRELGRLMQTQTRQGDVACRYGGEEFVLILPGASRDVAFHRAEELRVAYQSMRQDTSHPTHGLSISLGVAAFPTDGQNSDDILRAADLALYTAKTAGRNCTHLYSREMDPT